MWRYVLAMVVTGMASASHSGSHNGGGGGGRSWVPCEEARLKCAYRDGCGKALQNYIVSCSAVLQDPEARVCPEICQHALIALTSTEEGKELMTCDCSDSFCTEAKKRVEICRPQVVIANRNETVVSCRAAQWICSVDALCYTALEYYNRFCRSMFHGKKCSNRCRNSISILRRQEKAAKLKTCKCDGMEDYDCLRIQANMARLCFHKNGMNVGPVATSDNNVIPESPRVTVGVAGASSYAGVSLLVLLAAVSATAVT